MQNQIDKKLPGWAYILPYISAAGGFLFFLALMWRLSAASAASPAALIAWGFVTLAGLFAGFIAALVLPQNQKLGAVLCLSSSAVTVLTLIIWTAAIGVYGVQILFMVGCAVCAVLIAFEGVFICRAGISAPKKDRKAKPEKLVTKTGELRKIDLQSYAGLAVVGLILAASIAGSAAIYNFGVEQREAAKSAFRTSLTELEKKRSSDTLAVAYNGENTRRA